MKILQLSCSILFVIMTTNAYSNTIIKEPNVAGQFYEANPTKLRNQINQYISNANTEIIDDPVEVIIVPHAGHMYSGPVAAYSFKAISQKKYSTIVLLGPTHFYQFDGTAIWSKGAFKTPLGSIKVDEEFAAKIMAEQSDVRFNDEVFIRDHVLEVELPFLQTIYNDFKIVPMIMDRNASADSVKSLAITLDKVVGARDDVLVLISSDLSHYHDAKTAKEIDMRGLAAVEQMDVEKLWRDHHEKKMEIDGFKEVIVGLLYAKLRGAHNVRRLNYAHSGDITGDNSRVVGYAAMVITKDKVEESIEGKSALSLEQKKKLMSIARKSIEQYVGEGQVVDVFEEDKRLLEEEGAFVSVYKDGKLRGCIGNILGSGPLCLTVQNMAMASATKDTRFKPVTKEEISDIELEISVLSKPRRITNVDEIVLGKHGVIVSKGRKSGVFLPQVAESTNWSKEEFLSQLCYQKAKLPPDCWKDPNTKIEIYTAQVFSEKDIQ